MNRTRTERMQVEQQNKDERGKMIKTFKQTEKLN